MADLDDFFAKKDRRKLKSVKKFATADELAKKLEDTKQKTETRPKKERPVQDGEEPGKTGQEEEEWKEYEEPVKDYTGLKIQVLQGGNGAPEAGRDPAAEDQTNDNSKTKEKGPWNKPSSEGEATPAPVVTEAAPPPVREARPAAYVPPASRVRASDTAQQRRLHAKNAPDIHNDDYFPVLGAAGRGARGGGGWSPAAGGGASRTHHAPQQALALGNRFTTLQDDS